MAGSKPQFQWDDPFFLDAQLPDVMVLAGGAVVIVGVAMVIIEPSQVLTSWQKKKTG